MQTRQNPDVNSSEGNNNYNDTPNDDRNDADIEREPLQTPPFEDPYPVTDPPIENDVPLSDVDESPKKIAQ